MTIREHFQRFQKRATYFASALLLVALLLVNWGYHPTRLQNTMVAAVAGVVSALVMIPVFNGMYRCLRCGANFLKLRKQQFGWFSGDTRMFWQVWDKCPHCGISFDNPWP